MLDLPIQRSCRLSGESLTGAPMLLDLADCPLPGVYPDRVPESRLMRSPLRVVQAPGSGLVQLAHRFDSSVYADYGFAANTSQAYRAHLEWFATELHRSLGETGAVLEVGCGDGLLLKLLRGLGQEDVLGIDPARAAAVGSSARIVSGFFPRDLPAAASARRYERIVARHVLEHIEEPRSFIGDLAAHLGPDGELWIEVPDLEATLATSRWSNFYQLHCNYFGAETLDRLAAGAGLRCVGGTTVDVFGGSLLRRYRRASPLPVAQPKMIGDVSARFGAFQAALARLAASLPPRTVGYGAAERTALTLGACPALVDRLTALHDGNVLLHGRRLAGTALEIRPAAELDETAPDALILFAVSHREEIISDWQRRLDPRTLVAVADGECSLTPLRELASSGTPRDLKHPSRLPITPTVSTSPRGGQHDDR